MSKSANVNARMELELKEQAEAILSSLGIPASSAITMFYKQIVLQRGLPFAVRLPAAVPPLDIGQLTEEQLDEALEKGYAEAISGNLKPLSDVVSELQRDYGI